MASAHFSARPRPISRSQGESATAAAAYRARCELTDERTGQEHDYSPKARDVMFSGMYAPNNAPAWTKDRAEFWNRVEARENRKDSQLAREFTIALPHELTPEQNRQLLQDFIRENFVRRGYVADVNIHRPHPWGDRRNIHAHVMVSLRKFEGQDWSRNKDHFVNGKPDVAELNRLRDAWEKLHNRHMERHGHEGRISMRSYAERGIDRTPEIHLGKSAGAMERRGIDTDRGDELRRIRAENREREMRLQAEERRRPENGPQIPANNPGRPQDRPVNDNAPEPKREVAADPPILKAEAPPPASYAEPLHVQSPLDRPASCERVEIRPPAPTPLSPAIAEAPPTAEPVAARVKVPSQTSNAAEATLAPATAEAAAVRPPKMAGKVDPPQTNAEHRPAPSLFRELFTAAADWTQRVYAKARAALDRTQHTPPAATAERARDTITPAGPSDAGRKVEDKPKSPPVRSYTERMAELAKLMALPQDKTQRRSGPER